MADAPTITITLGEPWNGAGPDWPEASKPPSGANLTEGCWLLGLPTVRIEVERELAPVEAPLSFTRVEQAKSHPALAAVLELEEVAAVTAQGSSLLVSARVDAAGWPGLSGRIEAAIRKQLEANEAEIREKVQTALDREINPGVAMHGGYIELLDVRGTTIFIKMGGGCQGCGMASVTLKQGVERTIRQHVPEVTAILDTTDHASGGNPYYAPSEK